VACYRDGDEPLGSFKTRGITSLVEQLSACEEGPCISRRCDWFRLVTAGAMLRLLECWDTGSVSTQLLTFRRWYCRLIRR
jgi:hypothetical protein